MKNYSSSLIILSTFCIFLSILLFSLCSASNTLFLMNILIPNTPAQNINVCPKYINIDSCIVCSCKKKDKKHNTIPENRVNIAVPYWAFSFDEKLSIFLKCIFIHFKINWKLPSSLCLFIHLLH